MPKYPENVAFKIKINDEYICTAGIQEGVITAITDYVKIKEQNREEIKLKLGGLENNSDGANIYTKWIDRTLNLGDRIEIEIVRSNKIDRPIKKEREDPNLVEKEERKYYKRLKQKYGE